MNGYSFFTALLLQNLMMQRNSESAPSYTDTYLSLSFDTIPLTANGINGQIYEPGDGTAPAGGYARLQIPTSETEGPTSLGYWLDAAINVDLVEIINRYDLAFAKSTGPWEKTVGSADNIIEFALLNDSGTQDSLWGGILTTAKHIEIDTIAIFQAGDLKIQTENT